MSHRLLILLAVALFAVLSATTAAATSRIVGGKDIHVASLPYQVSIRRRSCSGCAFEHFANGAIYSRNVIITTASAIRKEETKLLMVVAGTSHRSAFDGMQFPVEKTIIHENFDVETLDYDIALLKLKVDLPLESSIMVEALNIASVLPEVGSIGIVGGWGKTSELGEYSETMRYVQIPTVGQEACREVYKYSEITENMFCAGEGDSDVCKGDAGAPFVVDNEIVGLVSWGIGCARPNTPGIYTNIVGLREWIVAAAKGI